MDPPCLSLERTATGSCDEANSVPANSSDTNTGTSTSHKTSATQTTCFSTRWTAAVLRLQQPLKKRFLRALAHHAATHPTMVVCLVVVLATTLLITGLTTNFRIEARESRLWTPVGSHVEQHGAWVRSVSFGRGNNNNNNNNNNSDDTLHDDDDDDDDSFLVLLVHHHEGANVVGVSGLERLFAAVDTVRQTEGYHEFCQQHGTAQACPLSNATTNLCAGIPAQQKDCKIVGATAFFLHNRTLFQEQVISAGSDDEIVRQVLSLKVFPGQLAAFDIKNIVGYPVYQNQTLLSGTSLITLIEFPSNDDDNADAAERLERAATKRLLQLRQEWQADAQNPYVLEILGLKSFEDEFRRGIVKDLPLLPAVFVVMTIFTCAVFSDRSLLGLGAVVCVALSIMTGYGLAFLLGIPFTNLAQVRACVEYSVQKVIAWRQHFSRLVDGRTPNRWFRLFFLVLDSTMLLFSTWPMNERTRPRMP